MHGIWTTSFFLMALLWAEAAHAFNMLRLADPAFQMFIFVKVPLIFSLISATVEGVFIKLIIRPDETLLQCVLKFFKANLFSVFIMYVVLFLLFLVIGNMIMETEFMLVIWITVIYFGAAFIWFAWWRKKTDFKNLISAHSRLGSMLILFTSTVTYVALYWYIYEVDFKYAI